jgi:quercetin dioxygenase-like cupin family protein
MDPLNTASNVYKQVMENDRVRVLQVVFKPGDIAKMHHHPDHVIYAIQGGKIKITSEGKTNEMDLKPGQALFLAAQNHEAQNIGKTTIELIVVELKK